MDAYGGFESFGFQAYEGSSKTEEGVIEYDSTLLRRMLHLPVGEVRQSKKQGSEEAYPKDALCCRD